MRTIHPVGLEENRKHEEDGHVFRQLLVPLARKYPLRVQSQRER